MTEEYTEALDDGIKKLELEVYLKAEEIVECKIGENQDCFFTYKEDRSPTITSIAQTADLARALNITGTNFNGGTDSVRVQIDGYEQDPPTSVSATEIIVPITKLRFSKGTATVAIKTEDGVIAHSGVSIEITPSLSGIQLDDQHQDVEP